MSCTYSVNSISYPEKMYSSLLKGNTAITGSDLLAK